MKESSNYSSSGGLEEEEHLLPTSSAASKPCSETEDAEKDKQEKDQARVLEAFQTLDKLRQVLEAEHEQTARTLCKRPRPPDSVADILTMYVKILFGFGILAAIYVTTVNVVAETKFGDVMANMGRNMVSKLREL